MVASIATVNRHYFNIDDLMLEEIVDGWVVPELATFTTPDRFRAAS